MNAKPPEQYGSILALRHPAPLQYIRLQNVVLDCADEPPRNAYHVKLRFPAANHEMSHPLAIEPYLTRERALGSDAQGEHHPLGTSERLLADKKPHRRCSSDRSSER